ncbi:MAG TPA: hypothetical protein VL157_04655 [Gemmatimonadaceae bacterium]|jgi:hypothetical protein|nr:hypothetical protein [Gemmatimonadaceae bacterium]
MIPNNAGYYHAAYIIVAAVHVAYAASIWWRRRSVRERLDAAAARRGPRG